MTNVTENDACKCTDCTCQSCLCKSAPQCGCQSECDISCKCGCQEK